MRRFAEVVIGLLTLTGICAAQQLTDAQRSAIKSACRGDYQSVCASVPPGTKDSLQCLVQHSQQVSAGCRDALAPATTSSGATPAANSAAAAPAAAASAAPAAAPPASHPLSRAQMRELRAQCGGDVQKFCSSVQPGGGRAAACLQQHGADLTPACRSALAAAAQ